MRWGLGGGNGVMGYCMVVYGSMWCEVILNDLVSESYDDDDDDDNNNNGDDNS